MKFALTTLNSLIFAGLLASAGAMAQGTDAAAAPSKSATANQGAMPGPGEHRMGRYDPAEMQAWMVKRQADMKAKLKITPVQEGAWTAFTAAMQPPAGMTAGGGRPMAAQRAELDKLTTPERIDKMKALRAQRMADMNAEMDKRGEATKVFYAALNAEQQKTFDAEHRQMQMGDHQGRGHHGGMQHKG